MCCLALLFQAQVPVLRPVLPLLPVPLSLLPVSLSLPLFLLP